MKHKPARQQDLDPLIREVEARLPGAPAEAVRGLARRLFSRGYANIADGRPLDGLADDVAALYRLLESAADGDIAIRIDWDPEDASRGVLQTVMEDRPFIVDTLREYLHSIGLDIPHLLHPVVVVDRDRSGRVVDIRDRSADGARMSVVHVVLDGAHHAPSRETLQAEVRRRLELVKAVTQDFPAMLEQAGTLVSELEAKRSEIPWRARELEEIQELLRWLVDPGFVFLGYRAYNIKEDEDGRDWIRVDEGSGLGILRDDARSKYHEPRPLSELAPDLRARVLGGPLLIISKTNAESPIRRHVRMDYVGIKRLRPDGTVGGEHRFLGLFTAKAFSQDASSIPILRRKLREILQLEAAPAGSHDYNVILQTFNSMPKEELFLASVEEIRSVIDAVMATGGGDDVRVTARPDQLGRGVQILVILPKSHFSGQVRRKLQAALIEAYQGGLLNYHLALGQGDQARLHFYLEHDPDETGPVDLEAVQSVVRSIVRTWEERLEDALVAVHGATRGHHLATHLVSFSSGYQAALDVDTAVGDVAQLARLAATRESQVRLSRSASGTGRHYELRLFAEQGHYVLSDVVPTLENLGLRVLDSVRFRVRLQDETGAAEDETIAAKIQVFDAEARRDHDIDMEEAEDRIADALRAIHAGVAEDDRLNELIVTAGLSWEEVAVLRAYAGYSFRIGAVASPTGGQFPLTMYPAIARCLFRAFEARFDPEAREGADETILRLNREFNRGLASVRGIEDDRTLRRMMDLVHATVRTNYYRGVLRRSPLLALKISSRTIDFIPEPKPKHEVYLRGHRTEAAHLRMDDVARGGIRWSDRYGDFRVEVLGLVKTQRVKNAVIVPGGAKGAFIVKGLPEDREARLAAGLDSYRDFIRGLLEISDDVVDGEVKQPEGMVIHDAPDPYLVVAADKGTAKNSDTANELAVEAGFWLGDAFASGGSQGYDHKKEGITARGAWECVKRHFRELDIDYENEPFTAVGIGDMSGDVFGNGMLLSKQIQLVAAFDHRHIFLDPDPDPGVAWAERKRLFDLSASSWADYDASLLSEGGGVYDRTEKQIQLAPQAQGRLGLDREVVNGNDLIRAILMAPVDLLWNGGIGTYVKAGSERHADVGDPSGDAVRVDAAEVQARVVGEGGNLGFTQRARVEFAISGGSINTDAVDNSAGVDMSDHEVNLKILLGAPLSRGEIDFESRNDLLRECTNEVAYKVLRNCYSQSLAISLDYSRARRIPAAFREVIQRFEREGILDPALEYLPTGDELIERENVGAHLTRPELATVLAYSKLHLKHSLTASSVSRDPAMMELVEDYFPFGALKEVETADLEAHRLRPHISSMLLTNRFVDRMGATSHIRLMEESGRAAATVARTWYVASRIADAEDLYERLRVAETRMRSGAQSQCYLAMADALTRATRWLLQRSDPVQPIADAIEWLHEPVRAIRAALPELLTAERLERFQSTCSLHEMDGLDSEAAAQLATFRYVDELLPIAHLIRETGAPTIQVGAVYLGLAEDIDFPWLRSSVYELMTDDPWDQRAARVLVTRLERARSRMAALVIAAAGESTIDDAMRAFRRRNAVGLSRIRNVISDIRSAGGDRLSGLVVAVDAVNDPGLLEPPDR
ncbi:NAD-glutamate dehydrogenase [Candidatus Palauibacter sp.]|uniref:NAD-glutamate dehydrogenase n=1 Tax=Candidatus Palauibacter sp. TaxID=3101350 RepID=UPI003B5C85CE